MTDMRKLYNAACRAELRSAEGRTFEEWRDKVSDYGLDDARQLLGMEGYVTDTDERAKRAAEAAQRLKPYISDRYKLVAQHVTNSQRDRDITADVEELLVAEFAPATPCKLGEPLMHGPQPYSWCETHNRLMLACDMEFRPTPSQDVREAARALVTVWDYERPHNVSLGPIETIELADRIVSLVTEQVQKEREQMKRIVTNCNPQVNFGSGESMRQAILAAIDTEQAK